MLAQRRDDVAALNATARAMLVAEGIVDDRPLYCAGRPFAIGDRIMTMRNDQQHGLINGQRGTITGKQLDGFIVRFDDETRPRLVPDTYLDAGHIDHAYAMTIHKAQGLTCDRAYVLAGPDLYAEAGYTALSRGRHENRLYLTDTDGQLEVDHHGAIEPDPIDDIRAALWRSQREQLATHHLTRATPHTAHPGSHPEPPNVEPDDGIDLGW